MMFVLILTLPLLYLTSPASICRKETFYSSILKTEKPESREQSGRVDRSKQLNFLNSPTYNFRHHFAQDHERVGD